MSTTPSGDIIAQFIQDAGMPIPHFPALLEDALVTNTMTPAEINIGNRARYDQPAAGQPQGPLDGWHTGSGSRYSTQTEADGSIRTIVTHDVGPPALRTNPNTPEYINTINRVHYGR